MATVYKAAIVLSTITADGVDEEIIMEEDE